MLPDRSTARRRAALAVGLASSLTAGCLDRPPPGGTLVGNPGKTEARMAPIDGIAIATGTAADIAVDYLGCAGERASAPQTEVSLVEEDPILLPGGTWCGLVMSVDRIDLVGATTAAESVPAEIHLEPALVLTVWTDEPLVVDETDTVLELAAPGWLSSTQVDVVEGGITVGPDSPIAAALTLAIARDSAWFADDGDGALSPDERAAGPIGATSWLPPEAYGASADGDGDTGTDRRVAVEGCNCAVSGSASPVGGAALALGAAIAGWAARRRRS